jgi:hypothetical protein
MKMKNILAVSFLSLLLVSCKTQVSNTNEPATGKAEKESGKTGKHKYELKSGIVEYDTKSMGTNMKQIIYFDNYGEKEATEISLEIAGFKTNTRTLTLDGYTYTLDLLTKTGTKQKLTFMPGKDIDFTNLSEEITKQMNMKKVGSEDFNGKSCDKFTIDNKDLEMKGSFLVWKGIPLKSEVDFSTMKTVMVVKSLQENVSIPSEKFIIPADFTIKEETFDAMESENAEEGEEEAEI